ncbi:MAG: class F sortase [Chloroflexi bacterium]|nr:class F sortase [Chloroflexota bacterium]
MQVTREQGALERPRQWKLMRGLAAAAVVAALTVAIGAAACGGGSDKDKGTPTAKASATKTKVSGTPTPGQNVGLQTPIAFSAGDFLTQEDLASRGRGEPGRGEFTGQRLVIPAIGVDAPFTYKLVGGDGQMPNPEGPEDVAYYDFSAWPGLGGLPDKGGNVVLAGHVDYINYGPAVFWKLRDLKAGDEVQIALADGTLVTYVIEFNKTIDPESDDWSSIVEATQDDSVTLITCSGEFSAGHYSNRQIIWGRRKAA